MHIFLLEDDIALQSSIKMFLESKGFHVDTFYDGEVALESIDKHAYDLYLLDINVPGINGLQLLELIHNFNKNAKLLIISASNDIDTIKQAYKNGAIDYIKKPFFLDELYYKINIFAPKAQEKSLPTSEHLTKKERQLLKLLLENEAKAVEYAQIEEHLYPESTMSLDAIRGLVKRLRKKLKSHTIKTISGVGYKLEKI